MENTFTEADVDTVRKVMAIFNGFSSDLVKLETGEVENDTLIIGHYSITIGTKPKVSLMGTINALAYITGMEVSDSGNYWEPPTTDYVEGESFFTKSEAIGHIAQLWAKDCVSNILESIHLDEISKEPHIGDDEYYNK